MPNCISIVGKWYLLSDDSANAATEVTAIQALTGQQQSSANQIQTTVNSTDSTIDCDGFVNGFYYGI